MVIYFTEEEYIDLITSYDFITSLEFKTRQEIESAFLFFQEYDKLTRDVQDYLLDLMNKLPAENLSKLEALTDSELNLINSVEVEECTEA